MEPETRLFVVQIVSCVFYFILAIVFVFIAKDRSRLRFVPLILLFCYFLLDLVPEVDFSDVRSHWHWPAAVVAYSLLYFVQGMWFFRRKSRFQSALAFASFMAGTSFLSVGLFLLSESWSFYHVLLPHH